MIYPWQHKQWQYLLQAKNQQHLAHALLFSGTAYCGKKHFAHAIAKKLLCQSPLNQEQACGQCKSCHVFQAKSHPDYQTIGLLDDKKDISIQQIRELSHFLELSCSYGMLKIGIINDAERMSASAANSLLKTLEEPQQHSLIILVSSQPSALTATIRSRCQTLNFARPETKLALNWLHTQALQGSADSLLSIAAGQPLLAKQFDQQNLLQPCLQTLDDLSALLQQQRNFLLIAETWETYNFPMLLNWQIAWVQQLIYLHNNTLPYNASEPILTQLKQLLSLIKKTQLWILYDQLLLLIPLATHSVNKRLFAEKMLLTWLDTQK